MSAKLPEPFSIPESERAQVCELQQLLQAGGVCLIGLSGPKLEIPETLRAVFVAMVSLLGHGACLHVISRKRAVTTERAAWILGTSRPFVVKLLQSGILPCHRVGNHRQIYVDDILAYLGQRDAERESLSREINRINWLVQRE